MARRESTYDEANTYDDPYARRSFSLRRMTRAQLWSVTIVSVAVIVAALIYAFT